MDLEPHVKSFFERLGYRAEKILETSEDESPDFFVKDDASEYLVELKTKFASEEKNVERDKVLKSGEIHGIQEPIIRQNRMAAIIKKAQSQIDSKANSDDIFRIVWLLSTGYLAEANTEQFEATLYGSTTVCDWSDGGDCKPCYFFTNSEFYNHRENLDAAIVSDETNGKLLLNPLSPRFKKLKKSSLVEKLGSGVVDPVAQENAGQAYYVNGDVDRKQKEEVLQYLRKKYKSEKLLDVTMKFMSGEMLVPHK